MHFPYHDGKRADSVTESEKESSQSSTLALPKTEAAKLKVWSSLILLISQKDNTF